jgi:hypothetical protein
MILLQKMQLNHTLKKILLCALLLLMGQFSSTLKAAHNTFGSEIWATHITKNKYEISYRAYKMCGSTSPPSFVYIHAFGGNSANTCGFVNLTAKLFSSTAIGPKCSTAVDCSKSYLFNEHIYKCTVDLDSSNFKTIVSSSSCKKITFVAMGYFYPYGTPCYNYEAYYSTTLYLENLANCAKTTNIPPAHIYEPMHILQQGRNVIFNQGLSDTAERDILRYELSPSYLSQPYYNQTCINTPTKDLSHPFTPTCVATTLCSANTKTNPVRGTYFDSTDGSFIFCPSIDGEVGIMCVKVKEYRIDKNGKYTLIAEHQREIAAVVVDQKGDNETPRALLTQKTVMKVCVGTTIKQKFVDFDDVIGSAQTVADSLQVIVPPTYRGASIKVYSSAKNKRTLEFNWTPTLADTFADGYVFPIKVVDLHCSESLATTYNLIVKVYPTPSGTPQIAYKGCNKLTLNVKNFTGGNAKKVSWQVLDSTGKTIATTNLTTDSVRLIGSNKYKILALLSNEGGCFKAWDTTISVVDTVIGFNLGSSKPFADTINCPNSQLYLEPKNIVARKGTLTYQWYGMDAGTAALSIDPLKINLSNLPKIGSQKGITVKTNNDTSALLAITDSRGCTEVQQMNITQIYSDPVKWKQKPLPTICSSDPALKLIDPTTKDMLDGGLNTYIRCLNGKYLDSLGPNYYKLNPPPAIPGTSKITLNLVAAYDTLGCISSDNNTIDVLCLPQFTLSTTKTICSADSSFFVTDAVESPAKNALPYGWKIIGMPSKSIAQMANLYISGKSGLHLVTHFDSLAIGNYKLQACATDSTTGCFTCDTATIISKPQSKFQYTGDTIFCPNDKPFRLRDKLKISSGESSDTTYRVILASVNGNPNPSPKVQRVLDQNSSTFTPRMAVGNIKIRLESSKYCYANGEVSLRIQDTLPISFSVSPDTVVRLPRTSFTFSANTNSPQIWWYFGTGNPADTSVLDPITWSYDSKVANYKVTARSFHNNGCYGDYTQTVSIWDVSGLTRFNTEAKITPNLMLISNIWQLDALELYDLQGKLVYHSEKNTGAPAFDLSQGVYLYKIKAHSYAGHIEKSGKWWNFGQ